MESKEKTDPLQEAIDHLRVAKKTFDTTTYISRREGMEAKDFMNKALKELLFLQQEWR